MTDEEFEGFKASKVENQTFGTAPLETPAGDAQQAPPDPAPESVEQAPGKSYTLASDSLYRDFVQLYEDDDKFRDTVSSAIGRTYERKWKGKLDAVSAERDNLLREKQVREERERVSGMTPEQRDAAMKDPAFVRRYADLMEPRAAAPRVDPREIERNAYDEEQQELSLVRLAKLGAPETRLQEYRDAGKKGQCPWHPGAEHGAYDHDGEGRMFAEQTRDPEILRRLRLDRFRSLVDTEFQTVQQQIAARTAASVAPAAAPVASPPAPQAQVAGSVGAPNSSLQRFTPDQTASGGRPATGSFRYTQADLKAMNPNEKIAAMETLGMPFEAAIKGGLVEPPANWDPVLAAR